MENRIKCIDGWRAIAAIGVLFTHTLGLLNHPKLMFFSLDLFKVLNILGSGVHLFFVISGFCFFIVMTENNYFTFNLILKFWKKRWFRIAPLYYVACIFYGLLAYGYFSKELIFKLLSNFIFLQPYISGAEITPIFWSLSVEWIFYIFIPFIFILIRKFNILSIVGSMILTGLLLNLLHYLGFLYPGNFSWYYTIFANFEHFGWGILLGYIYSKDIFAHSFFLKIKSFWLGFIIAYTGKIFFYSNFLKNTGSLNFLFESIGPLIMTLGFSIMILSSLKHPGLNKKLSNKLLVFLGKISYSFYVWHILVIQFCYHFLKSFISDDSIGVIILTTLSLIILIPISFLSFNLLESFYFNQKKVQQNNLSLVQSKI